MQLLGTSMDRFQPPNDHEGECECCADCDDWLDWDDMYEVDDEYLCASCLKDRFKYSA